MAAAGVRAGAVIQVMPSTTIDAVYQKATEVVVTSRTSCWSAVIRQRLSAIIGLTVLVPAVAEIALAQNVTVTSLTLKPTSVTGGQNSTGQVSLSGLARADFGAQVELLSSNPAVAEVPVMVLVQPLATTASFTVVTRPVALFTTVTITAHRGGLLTTTQLNVAPPVLTGLTLNPFRFPSVFGNSTTSHGQVSLNGPAPASGFVVQLSSSNRAVTEIPDSVAVAAGAVTASFTLTTVPVAQSTVVTITATAAGVTRTARFAVAAPPPELSSFTLTPSSPIGGLAATGQVHLTAPAPKGGLKVTMSSSNPTAATVPASVDIPAGATTSLNVNVTTVPVAQATTVTITATLATGSRTAQLTVASPVPSSFTLAPSTVTGHAQASATTTGTVTLSGPAPTGGCVVQLSSGIHQAMVQVPPAVTVPAGETMVSFGIAVLPLGSGGGPPLTVTLTAAAGGVSKTALLTVNRI